MKLLKLLPIICLLFISLSCANKKEIYKYKFSYETSIVDTISNKLFFVNGTQDIYVQDNTVLLERFIPILDGKGDKGRFEYDFFNKSDSIGSKYIAKIQGDTLIFIGNFNVLDFKKKFLMYDFSILNHTDSTEYNFMQKSDVISKNEYKEHYAIKKFVDITYPDSIVVSFNNNLKDYPFSLATILEDKKDLKVEKLHFYFKEHKDIKFAPARELILSIKKMDISDEEAINNLFNRFMRDKKNN